MLSSKVILVTGVVNAKSIAWNVAKVVIVQLCYDKKFHQEGASVIVTYQRQAFKAKVDELISQELANSTVKQKDCS